MLPSELVERGWCQGAVAKDASGNPVSAIDENAVCFCLAAALYKYRIDNDANIDIEDFEKKRSMIFNFINIYGFNRLDTYNDSPERTRQEIVLLLMSVGL